MVTAWLWVKGWVRSETWTLSWRRRARKGRAAGNRAAFRPGPQGGSAVRPPSRNPAPPPHFGWMAESGSPRPRAAGGPALRPARSVAGRGSGLAKHSLASGFPKAEGAGAPCSVFGEGLGCCWLLVHSPGMSGVVTGEDVTSRRSQPRRRICVGLAPSPEGGAKQAGGARRRRRGAGCLSCGPGHTARCRAWPLRETLSPCCATLLPRCTAGARPAPVGATISFSHTRTCIKPRRKPK